MKIVLLLITGLLCLHCIRLCAQKKFGYAVLNFRCGENDTPRDRVYYSPVIELNNLNFPQYTNGMDTAIKPYSVRYYNYAIVKWFEIYLRKNFNILVNTPDKYERNSAAIIYNKNNTGCDADKTNAPCFYTDKEQLTAIRKTAIDESRSKEHTDEFCEIIDL